MFTGIIDHFGTITAITPIAKGLRFAIQHSFSALELGESIAVNGICLTVTDITDDHFYCDLSPETLKVTTAQHYKPGQAVNLERALLPTTRIGGHFVSGHVDEIYYVKTKNTHADFVEMTFAPVNAKSPYFMIKKGSITVDGVSLTVNALTQNEFSIMLIPHTLQRTTLSQLEINNQVNIEFDMILKWAANNNKESG